jgi:TPR repeat protein
VYLGHAFRAARYGCPKNPAIALHYFRLAAWQGEPDADHQISTTFGWGEVGFVDVHPRLAYIHARRAAEDGYAPAMTQVGYFHEKGVGVKESKEKAREWYLRAIAKGEKLAQERLDALRNRRLGATR